MEQWELLEQNPWWDDDSAIERDGKILEFEKSRLNWIPRIFDQIDFTHPRVYTIRGPRQVGKTTLQKLLIRRLINGERISPRAILYYSLDFVHSYREIADIYRTFKDFAEKDGIKRTFVFLDEITSVIDWQKAIKHLIDIGTAQNTTFILTGSSAIDIKRGTERMPGRRGGGRELDKVLLPLSFRDYLDIKMGKVLFPVMDIEDMLNFREQDLGEYKIYYHKIQSTFEDFSRVGGFPHAIDTFLEHGKVSDEIYDTLFSVIVSDIEKMKMSRVILGQTMRRIYELMGSRWSWQGLAKGMDIGSFHTARGYIETLADSYILSVLYFWNTARNRSAPKKEKKVYLVDPLIYHIFANSYGVNLATFREPSLFSRLVENTVFSHLLRTQEETLSEGLAYLQNIFYWYSNGGNEIDFLVRKGNSLLPVEVKYQSRITPANYTTLKRVFKRGIVLTKDAFFSTGNIVGIPVSIFLSILGKK